MIFTKKLLLIKGGAFKLFLYKFKHHAKVLENIMMDKSLIHKIFAVVALSVAGIDCIGIEGAGRVWSLAIITIFFFPRLISQRDSLPTGAPSAFSISSVSPDSGT